MHQVLSRKNNNMILNSVTYVITETSAINEKEATGYMFLVHNSISLHFQNFTNLIHTITKDALMYFLTENVKNNNNKTCKTNRGFHTDQTHRSFSVNL